jgi:hypothetical protein
MTLRLREVTDDERTEVQRITRSHTLGAAFVRRGREHGGQGMTSCAGLRGASVRDFTSQKIAHVYH